MSDDTSENTKGPSDPRSFNPSGGLVGIGNDLLLIVLRNTKNVKDVQNIVGLNTATFALMNHQHLEWATLPARAQRYTLCTSADAGNLEIMQYLLEEGASVNQADSAGWTPLHAASYRGHLPAVEFLVSHGADVDRTDNFGRTPLYIASKHHQPVSEYLVAHGAHSRPESIRGSVHYPAYRDDVLGVSVVECTIPVDTYLDVLSWISSPSTRSFYQEEANSIKHAAEQCLILNGEPILSAEARTQVNENFDSIYSSLRSLGDILQHTVPGDEVPRLELNMELRAAFLGSLSGLYMLAGGGLSKTPQYSIDGVNIPFFKISYVLDHLTGSSRDGPYIISEALKILRKGEEYVDNLLCESGYLPADSGDDDDGDERGDGGGDDDDYGDDDQ